jgi:outer membrane protein insertion porin family
LLNIFTSWNCLPFYGFNIKRIYVYILKLIILSMAFLLLGISTSSAETSPLIKSIEVEGNKKISENTIYSKIKSRVGAPFSKNTVREDIKRIHRIGYFEDVRVDIDTFEGGVKLIFILVEKPTVVSVDFAGNEEYDEEEIKEHITITPGAIANFSLITDNTDMITAFYHSKGYWHARVVPIINEISEDTAALTFQIDEGPEVAIEEITFEGNKYIEDDDIEDVMETKEEGLFSFITDSGIYRSDQIKEDLRSIRELYQNNGYIFATISEPALTLSPDREELYIKIAISEGEQYRVGDVKIEGNTVFPGPELYEKLETSPEQVFDRSLLRKDIDSIIDLYMEKGYARADIDPQVDINKEDKTANITLSITEGDIFRIGKIYIEGNIKTRDKVIRREVRLNEGDIFNKKLLTRSFQRINNLNFFDKVDVSPRPNLEEKLMDINIDVEEKLTGMVSLGGGYSSVDKFMVMGEITQSNLFGKGLYLKFRANFSSRRKNYTLSLRDPWFMDTPVSASISIYNEQIEYPDYDKKSTGGSIGFGKELSEYVAGRINYNIEEVSITNIAEDASSLIREQEGERITSSISPAIWRDTRDSYLDPTTGSRYSFSSNIAGLGGDNYFYKLLFSSSWYIPSKWDTTISARGRIGYASGYNGKDLPLYERFYVGGISTVRGLGFGEGGPRNAEGEKIGGNKELIFNAEYIVPIAEEIKLKGVLFVDYGAAFNDNENISLNDMRYTTGFGIRWMSPLGPIRLEWGFNLDQRKYEDDNKIEFTMGGLF